MIGRNLVRLVTKHCATILARVSHSGFTLLLFATFHTEVPHHRNNI